MHTTTFEEFVDLSRRGTLVPVCREIMADRLTPVTAFLKIAENSDHAFLLESVEGGEHLARYSFIGKDPFLIARGVGDRTWITRAGTVTTLEVPFVPALRAIMAEYRVPRLREMPRFTGGAVGYFGYDAAEWFEPALRRGSGVPTTDGDDQAVFMLFDTLLAFDHLKHRILIIANTPVSGEEDAEARYDFALTKIRFLERELERNLSDAGSVEMKPLAIRSNLDREAFEAAVRRAQEYIAAGDIYQVVLSRRLEIDADLDPFMTYRALRHVSPSPYMYYLRMGRRAIVGSSPEMLVRVEGRNVVTHPIAGTRPRGATEAEDARLAQELQRDEKECAEHVMLVDLARNDLGRVCDYGSVRVTQFMEPERYSHVMHLVSRVEGRLSEGHDRLDALVATFPAGTVSGAPKIRAMEIIEELEPSQRGPYAGAVGYFGFSGNMDTCINIRTVVVKGRQAFIQAGAGIVADSDPEAEYVETCNKAKAMMRAVDMAERGLD